MAKVKICGITNAQDALWAANLGADFIGLNFYPESPRKISPKLAKDILSQLPPFVPAVALFVNETPEAVIKLAKSLPVKIVQLHGDETPEICRAIRESGLDVIKAFRLQGPVDPASLVPYEGAVTHFLFDTYVAGQAGGTGHSFNWEWLDPAKALTTPWFLAGGLKPDNIADAVKRVSPSYVDVCSGVEKSPKRKDYDAMKRFIQLAKGMKA